MDFNTTPIYDCIMENKILKLEEMFCIHVDNQVQVGCQSIPQLG